MSQPKKPHDEPSISGKDAVRPGKHDAREASLVDRIGESASSLLQSSWRRPAPHAVTDSLASIHASGSKGGSSSNSSQRYAASAREESGVTQMQSSLPNDPGSREYFRTHQADYGRHVQNEFDEWSTVRTDKVLENALMDYDSTNTSDWRSANQKGKTSTNTDAVEKGDRQPVEAEISDGAKVISLLSNPDFVIEDVPSSVWEYDPPAQEPQLRHADQLLLSNGIKPTIFPRNHPVKKESAEVYQDHRTEHQSVTRDERGKINNGKMREDSLGLIPDFGGVQGNFSIETGLENRQWDDLKAKVSNISDGDVKPWLDILNRYQDEVWGNMLPLVQRAREEVRTVQDSKIPEGQILQNGPAVQRLKMILQHFGDSR